MKQNYKMYLCALLLVGAVNTMTIGALGADKPKLAVFVVGMDNTLGNALATQMGSNLTSGGQYALTSVNTSGKRDELRVTYASGGGSSIDRSALAEWGRTNGISAICLVVDDVKGSDHMFYAQLIDAKDSKLSGKGSYVRTGVGGGDIARVSLMLAKQLEGPERMARKDVTPQQKWFEPEMVQVVGGTTTLGWHPDIDADRADGSKNSENGTNNNIKDQYTATVANFKIGKYEVTQAQWRAVMTGTKFENYFYWGGSCGVANGALNSANCGSVPCDDQRPAEYITWYMALAFCNRLSDMAGKTAAYGGVDLANIGDDGNCAACSTVTVNTSANGYRLPTQIEWEYAARGCNSGTCEKFKYSGSNDIGEVGWNSISTVSTPATHQTGQLKPNCLGIYDMSGNVWEWCYDVWDTGSNRTICGGPWDGSVANGWFRVAARRPAGPTTRWGTLGLRVVLP